MYYVIIPLLTPPVTVGQIDSQTLSSVQFCIILCALIQSSMVLYFHVWAYVLLYGLAQPYGLA